MKRLFTILTVVVFTTSVSFAQFSAKAGLNMANVITNEDDADNGMKLGMIIGGSYAMELADAMNLDISLAFKQSGTLSTNDFTGGSNTITWSLNYLDISPSIAYSVSDQFALLFGPYLSFAMSGKLKVKTEITNAPTTETEQDIKFGDGDNDDGIKSMDFGLNFGASYSINDVMSVGAGYSLGLTNLSYDEDDLPSGEDQLSIKNSAITLTFGYMFGG